MRPMRSLLCGLFVALLAFSAAAPSEARSIKLVRDAEIEETLRAFAGPVFEAAGVSPESIRLHLVNSDQVNAFVSNGMRIFLYTGLLRISESPGQVIAVIAHETGHIAGGHLARLRNEAETRTTQAILSTALGAAAGIATGDPRVAQALISGGITLAEHGLLRHSRTEESAADQAALQYLDRAKVSSQGFAEFLGILEHRETIAGGGGDVYRRTHPLTEDRIRIVRDHAAQSRWTGTKLPDDFQRRHARMIAKLDGFLGPPEETLARYDATDKGVAARYARAIAYYRIPRLREALALIDGLIAEAPKDPYFHELRGQMLFENGRGAEALEAYRQAVRLSPHAGLIRVELGRAAIEVGTRETLVEAVRNLREVVRRTPRSASGWYWLGIAEGRSGRSEFADLALAEHAILTGDVRRAASLAGRAVRKLPESSADWHRAQDILNRIRPRKAKN
ncbi:MAG: M48 family metalloprotease [Alphaproteobacteria bacterium]|nr:M48 family metalloprotease [Alphaproteobacteria bacterium]